MAKNIKLFEDDPDLSSDIKALNELEAHLERLAKVIQEWEQNQQHRYAEMIRVLEDPFDLGKRGRN